MERCSEEVSSSQAGRQRVTPQETHTASSLVASMSIEELRLYCQVPAEISLEMSNGLATSIVGEADNAIYFTREQSSYTRAPECFLDSNKLQCAKLSLLAGHLAGGDLFHLHFEAWDRGPHVYVGP